MPHRKLSAPAILALAYTPGLFSFGQPGGKAAKVLIDRGFDAINMTGGILQWRAMGYQVVKEPQP